jgi:hypothetical protein
VLALLTSSVAVAAIVVGIPAVITLIAVAAALSSRHR